MGNAETDFTPIIDKKLKVTVSPTGEKSEYLGFEDLPEIVNSMGEKVTGDAYQQSVDQLLLKLPGEAVKTGYSWTDDFSIDTLYNGGTITTSGKVVYTITDAIEHEGLPCYVITSIGTNLTKGSFTQQGMDISMERNGKSEGKLLFAYTKGMMVSMDASGRTDGLIEVPAANMTMPQEILTTSSFKVKFK